MATDKNQDARLRKTTQSDSRAPRSQADEVRKDTDGTAMSPSERKAMLRNEFRQEALPAAPDIPGWHCCWLASNSSYDPLHKRIRMGYEPVKVEEVPSLSSFRMTTGEHEGIVACNEMLLFKIPNELYQEIMQEFHHDAPLREEQAIKDSLRQGHQDSDGKDLETVEGFEDLAMRPQRRSSFA